MKCKKCSEPTRQTNSSKTNGIIRKYRLCLNCRFRFRTTVNPVTLEEEYSGELAPIIRNHELHPSSIRTKYRKPSYPKKNFDSSEIQDYSLIN